LIKHILVGHETLENARINYNNLVKQEKSIYDMLYNIQSILTFTKSLEQYFGVAVIANDNSAFF
jgi:hypothetical protein